MKTQFHRSLFTKMSATAPMDVVESVSFRQAMADTTAFTENGALSLSTTQPVGQAESVHGRMAFFFKMVRTVTDDQLFNYLAHSDAESVRDTLVLVFHLRNCRSKKSGGKGERDLFRRCVEWYKIHGKGDLIQKNLDQVVEFGRWDDVLVCPGGHAHMARQLLSDYEVVQGWKAAGEEQKATRPAITLAAKWAPSACMKNKKSQGQHVPMVAALNEILATQGKTLLERRVIREREYRKMLSLLRDYSTVIERLMCANQWDAIAFNHVPSNAMHLYGKSKISSKRKPQTHKRRRDSTEDKKARPGAFMRH
jgi:hypothetical protein